MKTRLLKFSLSLMAVFVLLVCCEKNETDQVMQDQTPVYNIPNPDPSEIAPLPEIKLDLSNVADYAAARTADVSSSLEPSELQALLCPGETVVEHKVGYLAPAPPKGDIMLSFDLTGSMGGAINQAKANAVSIVGAVRTLVTDSYFGVMSHMDYNGYYSYCGYSNSYGGGPDYPYLLGQALTDNATDVGNAVNALSLGYGNDGYENYTRILYEAYADAAIGWRSGSKKILLAWLDNYPHDCDIDLGGGIEVSTGVDPGRDAIAGTGDDLDFDDVLLEMKANNVTPIVITTHPYNLNFWKNNMQSIGGDAYVLGADIVGQIVEIIEAEFKVLDEVTLIACDPAYADWISTSPSSIGPIDLSIASEVEFDLSVTVPLGTPSGTYEFDVCLVGDGAEYARQHVSITVVEKVPFDIHPTGCPNPINSEGKGVMPTAILGAVDLDVTMIDPETITLEGVSPLRWSVEDVATVYAPYLDKPLDAYACNDLGMDGFDDLTLKFKYEEVVEALIAKYGPLEVGQVLKVTITGQLTNGFTFIGEDIVKVVK